MRTNIKLTLDLNEALNLQSACMYAAHRYATQASAYPPSDYLHSYFKKRSDESQAGADLIRNVISNTKWNDQLEVIHECSHQEELP